MCAFEFQRRGLPLQKFGTIILDTSMNTNSITQMTFMINFCCHSTIGHVCSFLKTVFVLVVAETEWTKILAAVIFIFMKSNITSEMF